MSTGSGEEAHGGPRPGRGPGPGSAPGGDPGDGSGCEAAGPAPGDGLGGAGVYDRIYALVAQIPPGRVATYGQLARLEGHCSARQVGYALATTPDGVDVPWQRVINRAGKVSERRGGGGVSRQRQLLQAEGVVFDARGKLDLARYGWPGPDPDWLARHDFVAAPPPVTLRQD